MDKELMKQIISTLPDPAKDKKPPPVTIDTRLSKARLDYKQWLERVMFNSYRDTEGRVKYIVEHLFGGRLYKDGDWGVEAGGKFIWRRRIGDFRGYMQVPGDDIPRPVVIEVKSMSPGLLFPIVRLGEPDDKRSQWYKMTKEAERESTYVVIAIGAWYAKEGAEQTAVQVGDRTKRYWRREDVYLKLYFIPWMRFVEFVQETGRRVLRSYNMDQFFSEYLIHKVGNKWKISDKDVFWENFMKYGPKDWR